jgi:hypothetical protein
MKSLIYLETIQTLHRKFWQWLKDQIAQDVPEADGCVDWHEQRLPLTS